MPNIPDKPVLSDLFEDHLASIEHAHADKHSGMSIKTPITSIPVPVELATRQPATRAEGDTGTLVSSGWRQGR